MSINRTPEQEARESIDRMLNLAGWDVQDCKNANILATAGVVLRNFPLKQGHGFADYLLYVDGKAAGVIEAKKAGTTLTGVELQSGKYRVGLPDSLPAWFRPLPFCYESSGVETRFTNGLDPAPRSRNVFSFHRPLLPLSEQAGIVMEVERRLTISDEMEKEVETNLRRAERLRQSILKRAFSGQLVPQAAKGEPIAAVVFIYDSPSDAQ
jgi:type I site-specific restriction endonuclease